MNKKTITAVLLASSLTLVGCYFHGGTQEHVSANTLGHELTDLKLALDKGAISEQEYERKKENLINSRNKKADEHEHN